MLETHLCPMVRLHGHMLLSTTFCLREGSACEVYLLSLKSVALPPGSLVGRAGHETVFSRMGQYTLQIPHAQGSLTFA